MPVRRVVPIAAAGAALAILSACTNQQSSANRRPYLGLGTASVVAGVQQVTLSAGDDFRFHPSTIIVHPGKVRVVLANTGTPGAGAPHDWQLTGLPGAFVPLTGAARTSSVTFTAPAPGRYTFVCTIHLAQGQTGTLIVTAD